MKKRLSSVLILAGIVNFILFLVKFYIGIHTNSQSIYTDSVNNFMDTLSLCLALWGISFIDKPATERFKHGFGRMEYVTAFIMSLIMTVAGLGFAYTSIGRIITPVPVWFFTKYAIIIAVTCLVKLLLGVVFLIRNKKSPSTITKTVMLDSFLDCGITLITLISFTVSNYTNFMFDAVFGLIISIVITVGGIKLVISSVSEILGQQNYEIQANAENLISDICKDSSFTIKNISTHSFGTFKNYVIITMVSSEQNVAEIQNVQNMIKKGLNDLGYTSVVEWEVIS